MDLKKTDNGGSKKGASPKSRSKKPGAKRRLGAEDSETRRMLLDAAEQLMREEGYAAVSSRRIGTKAGVKPQLVHYYFRTMDDLFLALWRRHVEANLVRQTDALLSPRPLRALWESSMDFLQGSLAAEMLSLARHRKIIRAEVADTGERFRKLQASLLGDIIDDYGLRDIFGTPQVLSLMISAISRLMVVEEELGITGGHAQARALVEKWIDQIEGPPRADATDRGQAASE